MFVLSTSSIRVGLIGTCYWGIFCLLGQTWDHENYCHCILLLFCLGASAPLSLHPFNLSSFLLLSLQFLSRVIALLYYYLIELSWCSASINFLLIAPFIPFLNFSINSLPLYLLFLATLWNSYTNSSVIFPSCSNLFNSATFTNSLSPSLNFFLMSAKNSPTVLYSSNSLFRFFNVFSFQISTNPSCTYDNTYWIYSSTATPFIFICIYNLYGITNPETFDKALLNTCSLTTSVLIPATAPSLPPASPTTTRAWS